MYHHGHTNNQAVAQEFDEAWRKECITAIDAKNRSIGRDVVKNGTGSGSNGGNGPGSPSNNLLGQALIDPVD